MVQYLEKYEIIKPTNSKLDALSDVIRKLMISDDLRLSQTALEDLYQCVLSSYVDELEDDLETQIENAYEDGYESGREEGYDDGYESGYSEGYSVGYDDGCAQNNATSN